MLSGLPRIVKGARKLLLLLQLKNQTIPVSILFPLILTGLFCPASLLLKMNWRLPAFTPRSLMYGSTHACIYIAISACAGWHSQAGHKLTMLAAQSLRLSSCSICKLTKLTASVHAWTEGHVAATAVIVQEEASPHRQEEAPLQWATLISKLELFKLSPLPRDRAVYFLKETRWTQRQAHDAFAERYSRICLCLLARSKFSFG